MNQRIAATCSERFKKKVWNFAGQVSRLFDFAPDRVRKLQGFPGFKGGHHETFVK